MPTLDWIGKQAVVNHHHTVPFRLLKDVPDLSVGDPGSGNLIVQGDNLLALKALLPYYAGQVKCIYIDPPYNTGNEGWVYNDNVNSKQIAQWLGKTVGKEAEDLSRHDKWLCMMYPRLALLKRFLREDGSIWVSMDDSEAALLRLLLDEIFGRDRFIACNVWQKRYSRENREAIGDVHEYLLVYAMDPERFKETRNRVPLTDVQSKIYKNPKNDPRGRWRTIPMTAQGWRPNQMYKIATPAGIVHEPPEGRCWSMIESEFKKLLNAGRIYFGKDNKSQPSVIRFLSEVDGFVPWTWWPHEEVGHTDEARKEIQSILETQTAFDTPKPTRLLERVLHIATNPGDLVLDSFAGSGTTGHAVLSLNKLGAPQRRFLLVEMDSEIAPHVTAERVKRVAEGYTNAKGERVEGLGGGFRFCELGEPLFDERGQIRDTVRFADLARHVYFTETGEPLPRERVPNSPKIGECRGTVIYLLFNGILGDKSASGGNVLTRAVLAKLPPHDGPKVIYGAGCLLGADRLRAERITFRQTPYEVKVS
ncbi:MAG TPA: site-specific DNA-methyltransferase [Kiritimatiellia bacterium]|nr:site-specific DNA-methyltransferase [Kiritimatiellia bacterium]